MWAMWILVAGMSVAGYYLMNDEAQLTPLAAMKNVDLAGNMGVYRDAVLRYLAAHPSMPGPLAVGDAQLQTVLPSWYARYPLWRNYVAADGMVTVYAATLPPTSIAARLYDLSQRSILAGVADTDTGTLHSPVYGDTGIPLPAGVAIPNGSPVWMGRRYQ